MHFRISREKTYELINKFRTSEIFTSLEDIGYPTITAEKHISCYLWFIGHETSSYRDVADRFGVTLSTLYNIITRVTNFIMLLAPYIIKYPTLAEKEEIATFYRERKRFPGVIGNYYLLGDSTYPYLKELIAYRDNGHLTRAQRIFNQKLSSCRVVIENTFGCLKQRFRQLYHFKLRNVVRMVRVIHACCTI